jgi:hypothetical protein
VSGDEQGHANEARLVRPCEAIEAEFSWGPKRCGMPSTGEAIDAYWGTIHPVCADHDPNRAEVSS